MNKHTIFTTLVLSVAVFCGAKWVASATPPKEPPLPPISQIQEICELAALRVQIADNLTGKNKHWELGWKLHGKATLGVDLSKVRYIETNAKKRRAVLSLPAPHVVSSKVDHDRSAEFSAKRKTLIPLPGRKSLRDEVWKHADQKVARSARHEGYLQATRMATERALDGLFRKVNWEVEYQWRSAE